MFSTITKGVTVVRRIAFVFSGDVELEMVHDAALRLSGYIL